MESLERWWVHKYKIPSNSELFQSRTFFDLLVEYHLDRFEEKPLEVHRQADGEIQLTDTGDDLLDKWEQQIADGEEVDLAEAFKPEQLLKIKKSLGKAKEQGIHANYAAASSTIKNAVDRVETLAKEQNNFNPNSRSPFARK